jgi:hypothetical protein
LHCGASPARVCFSVWVYFFILVHKNNTLFFVVAANSTSLTVEMTPVSVTVHLAAVSLRVL